MEFYVNQLCFLWYSRWSLVFMYCKVHNISHVNFKTNILEIANLERLQDIIENTLIKPQYTR